MAIYFVQCGAGGPIKIGFSDNPTVRVPQIQVNHWQELTLLGVQDGTDADERALHARFSYVWIRGEWHWPAPALLAHISAFASVPDAVRHQRVLPEPIVDAADGEADASIDPRLIKAAYLAIAKGGKAPAVARKCGISKFAVYHWRIHGIPAGRVGQVSEITGIPLHELRPDIFPAPAVAETDAA